MPSLTQTTPRQRVIVIAGVAVLVACTAWIIFALRPSNNLSLNNNPTLSPDVVEAAGLTAELRKDQRFIHLEIFKIDEQTWSCVGEVNKAADVQPAKDRAKQLKSGVEWMFEIIPLS